MYRHEASRRIRRAGGPARPPAPDHLPQDRGWPESGWRGQAPYPGTRIESALEEINNGLERSRRYAGGPKGAKRPADAIGNAIIIARIATGEIEDITTDDAKNAAAVALGRMGGKARAEGMSAKRRREIAQKAAEK
jgi:hypothetical protein